MSVLPGLHRADAVAGEARGRIAVLGDKIPGVIDRTTDDELPAAWPAATCRHFLRPLLGPLARAIFPWLFGEGGVADRPDPGGHAGRTSSPTSSLVPDGANAAERAEARRGRSSSCCVEIKHDLQDAARRRPPTRRREGSSRTLGTRLLELSKCPDFVVNRGHYFGTERLQGGAGPERRRQARADRVPEDVLAGRGLARATRGLRVRRRRLGRRRRHGRGAARGERAHGAPARGGRRSRSSSAGGDPADPTGNRLPDDYDVPAFHGFASRERCDALGLLRPPLRGRRAAAAGPEVPRDLGRARGSTACSIRAPARSAAAPRTTR